MWLSLLFVISLALIEMEITESVGRFPTNGSKSKKVMLRIRGGRNAQLGQCPWMAYLNYKRDYTNAVKRACGGTLISDEWVLTAAHCLRRTSFPLVNVRLGDLDIDDSVADGAQPIDVEIQSTYEHPNFTTLPIRNDIGLIKLKTKVQFTEQIFPANIPSELSFKSNNFYETRSPSIMGWGFKNEKTLERSTHLQYAQIDVTNIQDCKMKFMNEPLAHIDDTVICAGDYQKDSCAWDSGGPLILQEESTFYVVGVTSLGSPCGLHHQHSFTGVYTKVAEYQDWIQNIISQ